MTTRSKALDCGFDPDADYGYYPTDRTARPLTADETATLDRAEKLAAEHPDHYEVAHVRDSARGAREVAAGKPVSRVWITPDPIADLVARAARSADAIAIAHRPELPATARELLPTAVPLAGGYAEMGGERWHVERIGSSGTTVHLRHDDYRGTIAVRPGEPRYDDLRAVAAVI